MATIRCPFCLAELHGDRCDKCGRDPTATRNVCPACKKMTPTAEPRCSHCGAGRTSELRWKIPLIIAVFAVAIALSIAIQLAGG